MIDLRNNSLPDTITVDGREFLVKTDFREWLKFGEMYKATRPLSDYIFLFKDNFPIGVDFFPYLLEFYVNQNSTPHGSGSNEKIFDYIEDGEYIVAGFMQAYNIDLTTCKMHWHLFKALFIGLPEETRMRQIMGMRAYKKDNKSYDAKCLENKSAWSLTSGTHTMDIELQNEINNEFYGAVYDPNKKRKK